MNRYPITYPSFYEVDDVPCILFRDEDKTVKAVNDLGNLMDSAIVAFEGTKITREQFEKLAKARDKSLNAKETYVRVLEKIVDKKNQDNGKE